jgi:Protein of unknown function (DUF2378)
MGALEDYIAGLPAGLDSYLDCQQKASIYRSNLERNGSRIPLKNLPPVIAQLVIEPLPISSWVATAHAHAYMIAAATYAFSSHEAFLADVVHGTKKLFTGPIYKLLMAVASPQTVVQGASRRWNALQRGTSLELEHIEPGHARVVLRSPPGLVPSLMARYYAAAFTGVLEVSRAKQRNVQVLGQTPTEARFEARWA